MLSISFFISYMLPSVSAILTLAKETFFILSFIDYNSSS